MTWAGGWFRPGGHNTDHYVAAADLKKSLCGRYWWGHPIYRLKFSLPARECRACKKARLELEAAKP